MTTPTGSIRQGRQRENILRALEMQTIKYLCSIMPGWVTSDMLTALGFLGSFIIGLGLYLGNNWKIWLLLSVFGFMVQWFGDSLDGRLAYYRNTPRKWYGWALDITVDWISMCIIGFGFFYYLDYYRWIAFIFIFGYGWSMINALLRYRITDKYSIDSHLMGPTELRIIISFFMILDIFVSQTLVVFGFAGSVILFFINLTDTIKILKLGDERDRVEKEK
ncbi:MAG: CDP-alcohol phosphatidyltransferase family protein [Saprospiraceae bacterium]|nr:CDP-alcohol phosphatidyltransferase family protein [Saprospiraceae bacterium]